MKRLFQPDYLAVDLRALALFRISLGFVFLWDLLLRMRDLQAFYGDSGMLSRKLYLEQPELKMSFQLFLTSGSNWGLGFLFLFGGISGLALMLGYRARVAGLACWLFTTFLQLRNPLVLDGGDELFRLLLFWTPFLPLAARWSVESRRHEQWRLLPDRYRSIATVALYLQYGFFYFFAAFLKNGPDWLVTWDALYLTLSIDQFTTRLGHALLHYPDLLRWGTLVGLVVEYLLAILLFLPRRVPYSRGAFLVLLLWFHLSLAAMLHLGIFEFVVILGATVFIPGEWLDRFDGHKDRESEDVAEGPQPEAYRLSKLEWSFSAFVIVYIIVVNLQSVKHVEKLPGWTYAVATVIYEHQHWHLFAPGPFRNDGWFVLELTDSEGKVWYEMGKDGTAAKPTLVAAQFPNQRWRRWLQTLAQNEFQGIQALRDSTADYLAAQWRRAHPQETLASYRLLFFEERSLPPGETPKSELRVLSSRVMR